MLLRLKKRKEFLAVAASGRKFVTRTMVMQYCPRGAAGAPPCLGVGFTVTKKQGGAVVRNRIRRRLKEAFRLNQARLAVTGWDVVVIGRHMAKDCPFEVVMQDMGYALSKLARQVREDAPDA